MSYLNSDRIHIFPIGDRSVTEDRLLSEKNLTNVFKGLTSKESYVLSYENNTCKFVLCGYYIEATITASALLKVNNPYLYAVLKFSEGTNNLVGDAEGKFQGVDFTTTEPDPELKNFSLILLEYTTVTGIFIPESSKFKYSGDSIYIENSGEVSLNKYLKDFKNESTKMIESKINTESSKLRSEIGALEDELDAKVSAYINRLKWKQYPTT